MGGAGEPLITCNQLRNSTASDFFYLLDTRKNRCKRDLIGALSSTFSSNNWK